jgi:hypothetical protein
MMQPPASAISRTALTRSGLPARNDDAAQRLERWRVRRLEVRLLPNRSSQRLIDPVLPAGAGFLEVFKHVLIYSQ